MDEISLLTLALAKKYTDEHGGGGGTTDYDDLSNKPQIAGTTLSGNKSLADLGIASAQSVSNITNGENINNFAGVETALDGVGTALATKQNATDNSLETDAKTIVGAINEHEGDISSLKSGLTNLDNEVNGDATTYPYADVITIEDAVPANLADCSVKIEPVQDLHGYDKPWVGGAGKQIIQLTLDNLKTLNTIGTWNGNVYTINNGTYTVNMDGANNVTSITADGTFSAISSFILANNFPIKTGNYRIADNCTVNLDGSVHTLQIFGLQSAIYVGSNSDNEVIVSADATIKIQITIGPTTINNAVFTPILYKSETQDSTFAPYTNICPITGHTEASVQRDGKNFWTNVVYKNSTAINSSGNEYSVDAYNLYKIPVKENTDYVLSLTDTESVSSSQSYRIQFLDASDNALGLASGTYGNIRPSKPFTTPSGTVQIKISVRKSSADIQLELGSTATSYVPYAGKTYTIALGDTIYGGTVDFDSGVMTVTHKFAHFTDLTRSNNTLFYHILNDPCVKNSIDIICDREKSAAQWGSVGVYSDGYGAFMLKTATEYSSASDCLAAYGGEFNICYPLATQFEVQLTPQQIQLLKGQNTLTASTGQISVTVNGVAGSIGAVQEQVNELADEVAEIKPLNYSTTEQKTGQKWIDGKKIYLRVWDFGENVMVTSNDYYTGFNIDSSSMDKILSGAIMNNDGTLYVNASYDPTKENHTLLGIKPVNNCNVRYLTLYYTKTT